MIVASNHARTLPIDETSQIGETRRIAASMARSLGFSDALVSDVSLLVTEAANNLIKHAGGGEILLHQLTEDTESGLGILALDKGPGMADVDACLRDGFSTSGSPGTGLGAMNRLSTEFEVDSCPDGGTMISMQVWPNKRPPNTDDFSLAGLCVPMPGETISGDAWIAAKEKDRLILLVGDGLGHGVLAAKASGAAVEAFQNSFDRPPKEILQYTHRALRSTRGAAIAVTQICKTEREIIFASTGNVSGSIHTASGARNMISHSGIVGHQMRSINETRYPWSEDAVLILHTDGIQTRSNPVSHQRLNMSPPILIAAAIYRDFKRLRDDVTVVAVKSSP